MNITHIINIQTYIHKHVYRGIHTHTAIHRQQQHQQYTDRWRSFRLDAINLNKHYHVAR